MYSKGKQSGFAFFGPFFAICLIFFSTQWSSAHAAEPLRGIALVIGQSQYKTLSPLPNPVNDARAIEGLLAHLGFETDLATDENAAKLHHTIDGFTDEATGVDVALVYYSGHAVEAGGINYLIPIDSDISSLQQAGTAFISLQDVLERLRTRAKVTIVLLDACRSNPFPKEASLKRTISAASESVADLGLAAPRGAVILENADTSASVGEVIGFAAEPGRAALDGAAGASSPYAAALLKHLAANSGYDFGQVMTLVTEEVYLTTETRQRPWTNVSLRRFLTFGGSVNEKSEDDSLLASERRKLLLTIAATPADMRTAIEDLARRQSIPLDPLYGMLKELQVDTSGGRERLEEQLRKGATNLKKLLAEKVVPLRKDPELIRLSELADRAQAEGALTLAKSYRAKVSNRADELDTTLDQRDEEIAADRIELANAYADYAATAALAFDYRLASEQYRKASDQVVDRDSTLALKYKASQAEMLMLHGENWGDKEALKQSLITYNNLLTVADREASPDKWAHMQNNRASTLLALDAFENGTTRTEEAVAAFHAALEVLTRERVPLDWASLQNNLGIALHDLGEREDSVALLEESVRAYRSALEERTREMVPIDWATTQNNLATSLLSIGQRGGGTARLEESVAGFRAALEVYTREHAPIKWASTQNNLGVALRLLGEQTKSNARLQEAVAAQRAALEVHTRDRLPAAWAQDQQNLGIALRSLGLWKNNKAILEEAVTAFNASLEVHTRARLPVFWADTEKALGDTFKALGMRESGTRRLEAAVIAYNLALEERTRDREPMDWGTTQVDLGDVLLELGKRENDTRRFESALAAYRAGLEERTRTRDRYPSQWAYTQHGLGSALLELGFRETGVRRLNGAAAAYQSALEVWTRERDPRWRADTQSRLGVVLLKLGQRLRNKQIILDGRRAVEEAIQSYRLQGFSEYEPRFTARLAKFDEALRELETEREAVPKRSDEER